MRRLARAAPRSRTSPPLAGVSLGTVSNVLNRPERVSAAHPRSGSSRRWPSSASCATSRPASCAPGTSRTLAYVMLDATQPVLHRRRAGHRGLAAEAADLSLFICNSDNRADREAAHLAHLAAAAGAGHPDHPGRPRGADASTPIAERGTPAGDRRPHPRRRHASARSPSTTCSAAGWPSSTSSTGATRGSPSSAGPTSLGQVRDRLAGAREAWAAAGLPADDLVVIADRGARPSPRAARPASGWPGCPRRTPPDRRVLRQRPRSRSACCSSAIGIGPRGARATSRSSATTTSSSPPPPRSRSPRCASPASELGRTAAELLLDEARPGPRPPAGPVPPRAGRPRVDPALRQRRRTRRFGRGERRTFVGNLEPRPTSRSSRCT